MQTGSLKPHVFTLWAMFTASLDMLARDNHATSMLLYTGCSDPSRGVLGVRLDQGVKKHAGLLDVTYLRIRLVDDTSQIGQIPFRVDRRCRSR